MNFSEKLQFYRKQQGMSQEKLAEVIGVSRQAVSKWESGQSYPEMDKLIALSELFQVSLDHLVKANHQDEAEGASRQHGHFPSNPVPGFHYEYKSRTTVLGLPLVHIHVGRGLRVAKGIIAIGNLSIGVLSLGIIALGGISFGAIGAGLITFAALALGLLLAAGGVAVGAVAFGGMAVGMIAVGGLAIGLFSIGGSAISSHMAIGGYASGKIAIGDIVKGAYPFAVEDLHMNSGIPVEEVKNMIRQEFQGLWQRIALWIISRF